MSKITSTFTKGAAIDWGVDTKNLPYHKLKDLVIGATYICRGVFVTTSELYGKSPVAITDGALINLPAHLLQEVEKIRKDPEMVAEIKAGLVGMKVYQYDSKQRKDCRSIEWVDVDGED